MKKQMILLAVAVLTVGMLAACSKQEKPPAAIDKMETDETTATSQAETSIQKENKVYPAGKIVIYATGNPKYREKFCQEWLDARQDIASGITIEFVQTKGTADMREKVTMTALAGATQDLPDACILDPVTVKDLQKAGLLVDETDYVIPLIDQMVDGAADDVVIQGKIWGLPESVRPQVLFFNKDIFETYDVDTSMMATMDGYIEAGRQLKEKSNGTVYLSYIDPGDKTWRYWGRRGLMPQAEARIWDENGEVVIGSDSGTKLAMDTLATLYDEGLLLKSEIMQPALYDAINKQQVATFYIGAFWDEFLRQNCQATAGQWNVMSAPVFESVGKAGAPVSSYMSIIDKGDNVYKDLIEQMWYSFCFDAESKEAYVRSMEELNAPYSNPISLELLKRDFWKEPSSFYDGQSFREMEGKCLENGAVNLAVTPQDAEADGIITAELEKYIAGDQTMDKAIANMDQGLKSKIGKAEIIK